MIAAQTQNQSSEPITLNPRYTRGVVLLVLGLVFLMKNYGTEIPLPDNWWAGFLLLIGVSYLYFAWRNYSANMESVRKYFRTGLALTVIGVVFLFGLDMGKLWPLFLVTAGLSALFFPRRVR